MALVVKSPPANAGDTRDSGSIPGSGRSPGGNGNPLQYSEKSHGQRSLACTVHGAANCRDRTERLSTHTK